MKFGVVVFPGSNCDVDVLYVLRNILKQKAIKLWHKETDLQNCDFIILPGGFSYGDYLRSGAIARFSPIMKKIISFANDGGFVMGICNGFQILCESGLLPGALLANTSHKFICKNVFVKINNVENSYFKKIKKNILELHIAHNEGNYFCSNDQTKEIEDNNQIALFYCGKNGEIDEKFNPNGSSKNIAGIFNKKKNILGMMPHPERMIDKYLSGDDGAIFFENLLNNLK